MKQIILSTSYRNDNPSNNLVKSHEPKEQKNLPGKKKFFIRQILFGIVLLFPILLGANKVNAQLFADYNYTVDGCNSACFSDASFDYYYYYCGVIDSWNWDFGDGVGTSTDENPCYTYSAPGYYNVTLTVYDGCGDSSSVSYSIDVPGTISAGTVTLGAAAICAGTATYAYSDSDGGGTWMSSDTTIATVDSFGDVIGVSAGTATISYMVSGSCGSDTSSAILTVDGMPNAGTITLSSDTTCIGSVITASSDGDAGGNWSSSDGTIAYVDAFGNVTGESGGTATITYTVIGLCGIASSSATVTVLSGAGSISLTSYTLCTGYADTATSDGDAGGTWSSSDTTVATVDAFGNVTGVSAGITNITYSTTSDICGISSSFATLTVDNSPNAGSVMISPTDVCIGSLTTASSSGDAGGTWSSSDTTIATVDGSGNVTGISGGSAVITYTVSSGCGSASSSGTVTVLPGAGTITLSSYTLCTGTTATAVSDGAAGGTWTSSDTTIVSVDVSGNVTGKSAGSSVISYTVSTSCGTSSSDTTVSVSDTATAGTITGVFTVCIGTTSMLSDVTGTSAGTWSSSDAAIATVDASGNVTGISIGPVTITYTVTSTCGTASTSATITVNNMPSVSPITGAGPVCIGSVISLSDITTGGTWSSSDVSIAPVDGSGNVSGIAPGDVTISYSISSSCGIVSETAAVTVDTAAAAIMGTTEVCVGSITILSDATTGGTWTTSDETIATVDGTGNVTGVAAGPVTITYSVTNSCGTTLATAIVIVDAPFAPIVGTTEICTGSTTTLLDAIPGGTWASDDSTIATVDAFGNLTGIAAGTATITYSITNSCGTSAASTTVTIDAPASVITGADTICAGTLTTLSDSTAGGYWITGDATVATVDSAGNVTGVSSGTATITYITTNSCGTTSSTASVTVEPLPTPVITQIDSVLSTTGTYSTYQWLLDGSSISGATSASYYMTVDGSYSLVVTNSYGCSDTSAVLNVSNLAVNNIANPGTNSIQIYPNPAQTVVHIAASENVNVRVTTIDGNLLREIQNAKDIDIADFANGVYLFEVYDIQGVKLMTGRIVKTE